MSRSSKHRLVEDSYFKNQWTHIIQCFIYQRHLNAPEGSVGKSSVKFTGFPPKAETRARTSMSLFFTQHHNEFTIHRMFFLQVFDGRECSSVFSSRSRRVGVDYLRKSFIVDWNRVVVSRIFLLYRFGNRVIYSRDTGVLFLIGPKLILCGVVNTGYGIIVAVVSDGIVSLFIYGFSNQNITRINLTYKANNLVEQALPFEDLFYVNNAFVGLCLFNASGYPDPIMYDNAPS